MIRQITETGLFGGKGVRLLKNRVIRQLNLGRIGQNVFEPNFRIPCSDPLEKQHGRDLDSLRSPPQHIIRIALLMPGDSAPDRHISLRNMVVIDPQDVNGRER